MPEQIFELVKISYSVILPVILGYFVSVLKSNKEQKKEISSTFEKINSFDSKIEEVKQIISEEQMRTARYRIIRYDDECRQGIEHSEDHEAQILEDIDTYKAYCNAHPEFVNHKGQNAMKRILKHEENETY